MKLVLKPFQVTAVAELAVLFDRMRSQSASEPSACLLNAPTGSGKTLILTQLLEELMSGGEESPVDSDPELICLWLCDQPELNQQTYEKMEANSWLDVSSLRIIDQGTDMESLTPGVWFLNTQKLGVNTSYVKAEGDHRYFSLWDTLRNTVEKDPARFVVVIDEAHRGAKGADAKEAETIMQKFVFGAHEIPKVPMILGISATPAHFVELCAEANRPLRRWDVPIADVRASGLLKEFVDLGHPKEDMPSEATLLEEAITTWQGYCDWWHDVKLEEGEEPVHPLLLIQVQDARARSKAVSETDLEMIVSALLKRVAHEPGDSSWIGHCFQDTDNLDLAGNAIRHVAPSSASADSQLKVLIAKTAISLGWDAPRCEVLLTLRGLKDETAITQMVGRMVRAPLARRIDDDERLNAVTVLVPYYKETVVEQVIKRLGSDPDMPPATVRDRAEVAYLYPAKGKVKGECLAKLALLPSYKVVHPRPSTPVSRLARLASLLMELGWEKHPTKTYRKNLIDVLLKQRQSLSTSKDFKEQLEEASQLAILHHLVGVASGGASSTATSSDPAKLAHADIEDLYALAGRKLGEGLHREYLRRRRIQLGKDADGFDIKIELFALIKTNGSIKQLNAAADELRSKWTTAHKAAITGADVETRHQQEWDDIEGAIGEPFLVSVKLPDATSGTSTGDLWRDHLYVDDNGKYHEKLTSWEERSLSMELANKQIVAWYRNPTRKPSSIGAYRQEGSRYYAVFPDFIVFRKTTSGPLPEIVDPHLLADPEAPGRARGLARYAGAHAKSYGRIELVIYEDRNDEIGKRIDLLDEGKRNAVAKVDTHAHLQALFASL